MEKTESIERRGGPGRGQGRKSLGGSKGESPVLRIRTTTAQHEKVETRAQAAGMSPSAWVRRLIDEAP